jgi:xanthine dehydrogenase iron-sulfur cluster and FAD-binding subunit A
MWQNYFNVTSLEEAQQLLAKWGGRARIVAGATDLIIEMERGVRKGIEALIDITRIPGLDQIRVDENDIVHLGPLVTHSHCMASPLIRERGYPLTRAAMEVGVPQIRNRGTIAGNLITASPANDTITPLMAMGAEVVMLSKGHRRSIPLSEFYTGVRSTKMQTDEILVDISFPLLRDDQRGTFFKLGLRRAQAIAVANVAVILSFNGERIEHASITLGSVAPTVIHAEEAEVYLTGKNLVEETIEHAALLAKNAATPIDDVRASKEYRHEIVRVGVMRCLQELAENRSPVQGLPKPVLLWGKDHTGSASSLPETVYHQKNKVDSPIVTRVNGEVYTVKDGSHKTLLRLLREDLGLIGTKEGCAEGECGACTVFLDGIAVMSCLVPAPRAHGAEIITIEGLADEEVLHPVQQAFIDQGAVQCGYCTPGFIMSAAKLLEEIPHPSHQEIQQAISGNLCRCTGYYSIISAIEQASAVMS